MKTLLHYKYLATLAIGISAFLCSCSQDEPDDSPYVDENSDSTILIYAVATNSLSGNLVMDKNQILQGAPQIDLDKNNVLLFQTVYGFDEETSERTGEVSLLKLVKENEGLHRWEIIKEYSNSTASLNPTRVSEIIDLVTNQYPADNYGLIFWSHSTGSQPYTYTRTLAEDLPMSYAFGQDKTTVDPVYEQINIDELANAVPSGKFNFIWFDSCYMSNIESIYQFKDKCDYYIGYPTEVLEYGLPYNIVLPLLTQSNPDYVKAADTFFKYYSENEYSSMRIATIAAIDMHKIDKLADFCKSVYKKGNTIDWAVNFIKYTRFTTGPFYDLGDYTKAMAELEGQTLTDEEWESIIAECVIYKGATTYDFAGKPIDQDRFSGISTHIYNFDTIDDKEDYYQQLDWFNTVFF